MGSHWPEIGQIWDFLRSVSVHFGWTIKLGSDWPQMGQIWDFLRSISVHLGSTHPNWVRLVPNSINLGLFKTNFSTFEPIWMSNLRSLQGKQAQRTGVRVIRRNPSGESRVEPPDCG